MAKKPMIGFTVNTKVKRFIKSRRKEKTLINKSFLDALDNEIKRVTTISTEKLKKSDTLLVNLMVEAKGKSVDERLICDVRIKQTVNKIRPDVNVSKQFLVSLNDYAAAVILASMELIDGAYMKELASGEAVVKVAGKSKHIKRIQDEMPVEDKPKFEPALPREHVAVDYDLYVQDTIIEVRGFRIFTAKTTERIKRAVEIMAKRNLENMGVNDDITIELLQIERKKGQ